METIYYDRKLDILKYIFPQNTEIHFIHGKDMQLPMLSMN